MRIPPLIYTKSRSILQEDDLEPAVNKASPVDKTAEIIEQILKQVIDEEIAVPPSNLPGAPDEHDEAGLHEAEAVKIPEPPGRIVIRFRRTMTAYPSRKS